MVMSAIEPATYEDLFDLPPNLVGEIIAGRLITHPRPTPKHARAHSNLGVKVGGDFHTGDIGPGGWWILVEPELHIGDDILVPDLAGWKRERMPNLPNLPDTAWFELAPDWVCEVLSPSTARVDRVEKMPRYARMGVAHAWLVDPDVRVLEAYENRDAHWLLLQACANEEQVSLPPFEALEWELTVLWAD
jgi:Uma2 family endonuclease